MPSRIHAYMLAGLALLTSQNALAQIPSLDFIEKSQPATAILDRSHAQLRLVDSASNTDSGFIETVTATITSQSTGDSEAVTLNETGPATGIFEGQVQVVPETNAANDGLLSSQWIVVPPYYDYEADQLDASAAGLTATVTVESARGSFIDPYGRETDIVALGETIHARLHVAGIDAPLETETLAFDVRDLSSYDYEYTSLEDPPVVDIYEGGTLISEAGTAIEGDEVLQTAIGRTLEGVFNQITTQVADQVTVSASRTALLDAVRRPRIRLRPGQELFVEVFDAAATGSITVQLDADITLDQETLTLAPLGGGLFGASIPTGVEPAAAENGVFDLHAAGGETLSASYADGHGGSSASLVTLPEAASRSALFVVGQTTLGAGDQAVFDHLTNQGWNIATVRDQASSTPDAWPHDLVLISSTVSSNKVGAKFRDVQIPVLVWEPYVLDDMAMTGGTAGLDYGSELAQDSVLIRDTSHPLSAGFSGSVQVSSASGKITYGRSGARAAGIARVGTRPERLSILAYEEDEMMVGRVAPARRASTFLSDITATTLTDEGWALFDATVCWAVRCDGEPLASFTLTASGTDNRIVDFDASDSRAADGATLVDFVWTFGDRGTGEGESIQHVYPSASYSDEHGFLATLTVTDSFGRSSTSSQVLWLSPAPQVLLVARTDLLDAGDAAIQERLRLHGVQATSVGHSGLSGASANGYDSIFISATVLSSQVGTAFKNTVLPVVTWETHLFDDMALTLAGGAQYGRDFNQPGIDIVDPFHPIIEYAASGLIEVDVTGEVAWGLPGAEAAVLAVSPADPDHAALFVYDDHNLLADGSQAAHRRVALWLGEDGAAVLTPTGWRVLDGIIRWSVDP